MASPCYAGGVCGQCGEFNNLQRKFCNNCGVPLLDGKTAEALPQLPLVAPASSAAMQSADVCRGCAGPKRFGVCNNCCMPLLAGQIADASPQLPLVVPASNAALQSADVWACRVCGELKHLGLCHDCGEVTLRDGPIARAAPQLQLVVPAPPRPSGDWQVPDSIELDHLEGVIKPMMYTEDLQDLPWILLPGADESKCSEVRLRAAEPGRGLMFFPWQFSTAPAQ